jgi:hypothetical protein
VQIPCAGTLSGLALLVSTAVLAAGVPAFDVTTTCRAAPNINSGMASPFDACMRDEDAARTELEKRWETFAPASRDTCAAETREGGSPSYVEVLTCLDMYAANARPERRKRR